MSEFTLAILLIFVVFPYIDKMTKEAKAQTAALRELADAASPAPEHTLTTAQKDAIIAQYRANKGKQ